MNGGVRGRESWEGGEEEEERGGGSRGWAYLKLEFGVAILDRRKFLTFSEVLASFIRRNMIQPMYYRRFYMMKY